jgi:hypothetical protein
VDDEDDDDDAAGGGAVTATRIENGRRDEGNAFRDSDEVTSVNNVGRRRAAMVVRRIDTSDAWDLSDHQPCVIISEWPGQNRVAWRRFNFERFGY